jgi:hypothetical protein
VKLSGFAIGPVGVLAGIFVAVALLPATVTSAEAGRAPLGHEPVTTARSLAGAQWHYRAQIDGRGGKDRITITAQPGFTLDNGWGMGQVLLHVDFAGGRGFAETWQDVSYYSVRKPWTPWLGATDLDRRGGKEILLGFSTGAHAQSFIAYAYRSDGELLTFRAPHRSESWLVNSSYGTGTSGWKCTRQGVQARAVTGGGGPTAKVRLISYAMGRNGEWRRTKRVVRTVKVDANGGLPASTATYAAFACPGLPRWAL